MNPLGATIRGLAAAAPGTLAMDAWRYRRYRHDRWTASGYVVLPRLGVYEPIRKYHLQTRGTGLSARLVFGTATTAAFSLLGRAQARRRRS